MIGERWLTAWETLPERKPMLWRAGVSTMTLVSLGTVALNALRHPPPQVWGNLVIVVLLLLLAFGQPILWNTGEHRLRALWRFVGFAVIAGLLGWLGSLLHLFPKGGLSEDAIASGKVVQLSIVRL